MSISGIENLRGQSIKFVKVENPERKQTIEALKAEKEKLTSATPKEQEQVKVLVK